ncbi:MAG: ribonuclease HI family protein [Candidatus Paceibacteria bacterium]
MNKVICYTDGSARGNPGPAAIGVYITDAAGTVLKEVGKTIGNSTNNYAEYHAVMVGLETLKQVLGEDTKAANVEIRLDSELVKKQLNNEYQINEPGLVPLFIMIHNLRVASFPNIVFTQISSEQKKEVDRLVNEALDGKR